MPLPFLAPLVGSVGPALLGNWKIIVIIAAAAAAYIYILTLQSEVKDKELIIQGQKFQIEQFNNLAKRQNIEIDYWVDVGKKQEHKILSLQDKLNTSRTKTEVQVKKIIEEGPVIEDCDESIEFLTDSAAELRWN